MLKKTLDLAMPKEKSYIEKVCSVPENGEKPVLLKFQNGKLASVSKETTQYRPVLHARKRTKGAVVAASGNIYHGLMNEKEELTDSYLFVRNRETNKVRIIPIDHVLLNNHIYTASGKESKLPTISSENSKNQLLRQFGGRKANRYVNNMEKMSMNIDIVKDELDNIIKEAKMEPANTNEGTGFNQHFDLIRPKFNKEAKNLHELYNVSDVVPQDLLDRLEEEAMTVLSSKIENLPIKSDYLLDCIKTLQNSKPSAEGLLHTKLIIYMDALFNMIKTRVRMFDKIKLSDITEKVENDIRNRFSDPNSSKSKLRTTFSTEKGLCHIIVIAVLISKDYQIDMNILAKELCVGKPKIIKFANIVCVKKKSGTDLLTLTLPHHMTPLTSRFRKKPSK